MQDDHEVEITSVKCRSNNILNLITQKHKQYLITNKKEILLG